MTETAGETTTALRLPNTYLFIDGVWREADQSDVVEVVNPATEEILTEVSAASPQDVDAAVVAARAHVDGGPWSQLSGVDRGRLLLRVAELIENNVEDLATLEALDIGKPFADPLNIDVPLAAETFRHFAGWADKLQGTTIPIPEHMGHPRFAYTVREPVGVVAAITPWNAPTMIGAWKIAPALAAGCAVVIKPPIEAPLSTLRLAELIEEAGVPAGAVNVIPGRGTVAGAALVAHDGVDKVTFTGSPEVGREIGAATGAAFKRVTLELGGKSPQIVFPDADLAAVLPTAAISVFANAGEICASGSRIFVPHELKDEIVEGLVDAARAIKVGDPFAKDTTMGSLINGDQLDRVLGYVRKGLEEGASLSTGGQRLGTRGYFVEPTVFVGSNDLTIAREEIFGPVGTVIPYSNPEEALRLANESNYGLTAVLWTRDLSTAHQAASALRAGKVWVNGWGPPDPRLPWGGLKESGVGQDLGLSGIRANTNEKVVSIVL